MVFSIKKKKKKIRNSKKTEKNNVERGINQTNHTS
jgi:hypothetical protein